MVSVKEGSDLPAAGRSAGNRGFLESEASEFPSPATMKFNN